MAERGGAEYFPFFLLTYQVPEIYFLQEELSAGF
jgi:hypothetical protein